MRGKLKEDIAIIIKNIKKYLFSYFCVHFCYGNAEK